MLFCRWLLFAIVLSGCASLFNNSNSVVILEIDRSVPSIRKSIAEVLPVGQRAISPNGREMLSRHFIVTSEGYKPAGDALERYYAKFTILGDRRPYNIEILVTKERRILRAGQHNYEGIGFDPRLAKELESKLRAELTKRRDDGNIIDDFRVF